MSVFTKVTDFFKTAWLKYVIRTFFEKIPGLNKVWQYVDGHKTEIGRTGLFISAVIALFQKEYCADATSALSFCPVVDQVSLYWTAGLSWLIQELGIQHAADKEARFGTSDVKVDVKTGQPIPLDK